MEQFARGFIDSHKIQKLDGIGVVATKLPTWLLLRVRPIVCHHITFEFMMTFSTDKARHSGLCAHFGFDSAIAGKFSLRGKMSVAIESPNRHLASSPERKRRAQVVDGIDWSPLPICVVHLRVEPRIQHSIQFLNKHMRTLYSLSIYPFNFISAKMAEKRQHPALLREQWPGEHFSFPCLHFYLPNNATQRRQRMANRKKEKKRERNIVPYNEKSKNGTFR